MKTWWRSLLVVFVWSLVPGYAVAQLGPTTLECGSLLPGQFCLQVSSTLAPSDADQWGNWTATTSQGAGAGWQYAARDDLMTGFTGSGGSFARRSVNHADGMGPNIIHANIGVSGVAHGSGASSPAYYTVGVDGQARWAYYSIGGHFFGTDTDGLNARPYQYGIGAWAQGIATVPGSHQLGFIASLGEDQPNFGEDTALIADNMGQPAPPFIVRGAVGGSPASTDLLMVGTDGFLQFKYTVSVASLPVAGPSMNGKVIPVTDCGCLAIYQNNARYLIQGTPF